MKNKKRRNFKREVKRIIKELEEKIINLETENLKKQGYIIDLSFKLNNAIDLLEQYRNFLKEPCIEWWTERSPMPDVLRYRFSLKSPEKYLWLQAYADLDKRVQNSLLDAVFEDRKREFAAEWFKSMKFVAVSPSPYERKNLYKKDYVHINYVDNTRY